MANTERHSDYLIIGGGMAADAAAHGIREADRGGSIVILSAEPDPPYDRPPLSKKLWQGKPIDSIWRNAGETGAEVHLGVSAEEVNARDHKVLEASGIVYSYRKLLIATGGSPRTFPFGGSDVVYFRTMEDYRRTRELADKGEQFVVIGGGFIGTEIAAALAMNRKSVTLVFPGESLVDRVMPPDLAQYITSYYSEKGVHLLPKCRVENVRRSDGRLTVSARNGSGIQEVAADGVIAGIGIEPNIGLASKAGLEIDKGIVVNEHLETSAPDIYAAGDVASYYCSALERRIRVEHEDNANAMGRAAGLSMAGSGEPFTHLSMFYSDMFELGYEAVGELDGRSETFADWKDKFKEGVVYYLRDGRVVGVLLWNVWEKVDAARELIANKKKIAPGELRGLL